MGRLLNLKSLLGELVECVRTNARTVKRRGEDRSEELHSETETDEKSDGEGLEQLVELCEGKKRTSFQEKSNGKSPPSNTEGGAPG